jgi:DNA invertase Pin-like site-specific DNA recombinase
MRIGYKRVSSVDQNTARQLDGVQVDKVIEDHCSGKDQLRPGLAQAMEFAREGDCLVVHSMDRLARNLSDLRQLVDRMGKKGVAVEFVKERLTFGGTGEGREEGSAAMSMFLLNILGAFAEFERALIRERQREGIAIAKKAGRYKGRVKVLAWEDRAVVLGKIAAGVPKSVIARELGVSRESLYKYLREWVGGTAGEAVGEGMVKGEQTA